MDTAAQESATRDLDTLHRLVGCIPAERRAEATRRLLELVDDPVLRAFAEAPLDDEPVTPDEDAALREADEDVAAGRVRPWEEARLELLGDAPCPGG